MHVNWYFTSQGLPKEALIWSLNNFTTNTSPSSSSFLSLFCHKLNFFFLDMNLPPEVCQISALGHWHLITEAEWERKSSTWGELWLMQKLKWWSRCCYYKDPEVYKDLLVERQKPGLFSLERLLHIEALSVGLGLQAGELSACLLSAFHVGSNAAELRAWLEVARSRVKADQ